MAPPTPGPVPGPSTGVATSTSNTGNLNANLRDFGLDLEEFRRANSAIAARLAGQSAAQSRVDARLAAGRLLEAASRRQRETAVAAPAETDAARATLAAVNDTR